MRSSLRSRNMGRQASFGFKSTKYSVLKKPVVSVPSSGRPTWLVATVTSGERSEDNAGLIRQMNAFAGPGARRESAAHPDGALVQVRQKFRSDRLRQAIRAH